MLACSIDIVLDLIWRINKAGMVGYNYNSRTWDVETGGSVQWDPESKNSTKTFKRGQKLR